MIKVFSGLPLAEKRVYPPTQTTVKLDKIYEIMAFKSLVIRQQRTVSLKYRKPVVTPAYV